MTQIIGILNLTLDSFSDGGMYYNLNSAKARIKEMINEGVDIIDIGAESTRSGFSDVRAEDQINTLLPVLEFIQNECNIPVSIDTRSSEVLEAINHFDISFINDVSSGQFDDRILEIVSKINCKYIMTFMPDEHKDGKNKEFKDILSFLKDFFQLRIDNCLTRGIKEDNIIIDPGVGFGKFGKDNVTILKNLDFLKKIHPHVCIGTSNKRFSSKFFEGIETKDDLKIANLAMSSHCVLSGISFLRVHDVDLTRDTISIISKANSIT